MIADALAELARVEAQLKALKAELAAAVCARGSHRPLPHQGALRGAPPPVIRCRLHGMRVRRRPSRVAAHLEMGNACIAVDEVVVVFGVEHCGVEVVTGEAPDAVE